MTDEEVFGLVQATLRALVEDQDVPLLQAAGAFHAVAVKGFYALGDQPEAVAMMQGAIVDYQALLHDATTPPGDRVN